MKFRWALPLLFMVLIFYMSHQPAVPMPMKFPHQDKLFHFVTYAILSSLYCFSLVTHEVRQRFFYSILFASLYGISDEVHQAFVPGRDASVLDWMADLLGACFGTYFFLKSKYVWRKLKG